MTTEDAALFANAAPTMALLAQLTPDERDWLYGYLWNRALTKTFSQYAGLQNSNDGLSAKSDWQFGDDQAYQQEIASMLDFYGLVAAGTPTPALIRADLQTYAWNQQITAETLRTKIAFAKARFWRGNPVLTVAHP